MATEWFYLDGASEHGPVSGQQLKQFADAGIVFPSTPVKRVTGDEISPWTRAGAVQGMYAGDVTDQLGEPICDHCGRRLDSGRCPICYKGIDAADTPANVVKKEVRKYLALRFYCGLLQIVGWVALVFGVASMIASAIDWYRVADSPLNKLGTLRTLISVTLPAVIGGGFYLLFHASAESLHVVMDIEENTRRTASRNEQHRDSI
jgi:hypothetical protein